MPDQLMYDAVNVDTLPRNATMVAGYVDGGYVTWPELVRRFPRARKVSITTSGDREADVIDVESGDASALKAVDWVKRMRRLGRRPVLYTSTSNWPGVAATFRSNGEAPPFWWAADWTGEPHLCLGSVATQYASPQVPVTGTTQLYDLSLVSPNWPDPVGRKPKVINIPPSVRQRAASLLRQAAAIVGIVIGLGNQLHLPTGIRAIVVAASGVILGLEHYVSDPTTGTGTPPPPADG